MGRQVHALSETRPYTFRTQEDQRCDSITTGSRKSGGDHTDDADAEHRGTRIREFTHINT